MNAKLVLKRLNTLLIALAVLSSAMTTSASAVAAAPAAMMAASNPFTTTIVVSQAYSWTKTWGGSGAEVPAGAMAIDKSGNIFIAGQFQGKANFDPAKLSANSTFTSSHGTVDAYLTKLNASGQYQWTRIWGSGYLTDTACFRPQGCGRDAANGVAVDDLGNAYVAGLFQNRVDMGSGIVISSNAPTASNNIFVAKFGPDGTTQWAHAWGGTAGGEAYTLAVDKVRGAVYVEGDWSTNPNTGTVNFNPGGPNGVRTNHGFYDAFLSKFDLSGNFQWVRTWGGSQYDDGPGVGVDPATGDIYVCGMYGSQDINFNPADPNDPAGLHPASDNSSMLLDVFLTKFDAAGNWKWVRTWGGQGVEDAGANVAVDQAGNVYATGRFKCTHCNFNVGTYGPLTPEDWHSSQGGFDSFVSKFKADGTFQWAQTWGGPLQDQVGALAIDDMNNMYVGGVTSGTIDPATFVWTTGDAYLRKFASDGSFKWEKSWGGSQTDWLNGLGVNSAHNLYASGSVQGSADFDPGSGVYQPPAIGTQDAFLSLFTAQTVVLTATAYIPLLSR